MDYHDIISIEPGKRGGKPIIRDLRITVQDVLEYLAGGMSEDEILADFPDTHARGHPGLSGFCRRPRAQADVHASTLRLLFDQNLSHCMVQLLDDLYPGTINVRDINLREAEDIKVWRYAADRDFRPIPMQRFSRWGDIAPFAGSSPMFIDG